MARKSSSSSNILTMEQLGPEEKDASRPYFARKPGEIGIYLAIYDAVSAHPHEHGSEHFYHMLLLDQLYEYFSSADILKFRGALDKKGLFQGTYLERFEKGIVLAVGFDNTDALDAVWRLQKARRLGTVMTDVLINHSILKKLGASKILLSTRLFDDEYEDCTKELLSNKLGRISISSKEKDMEIFQKLQKYREKLSSDVQEIRDLENDMEQQLGSFVMTMKEILPNDIGKIKNYKEFETLVKIAKGTRVKKMESVEFYMHVIKTWRHYFKDIDDHLSSPLLQIHTACENENQKNLKKNIRTLSKDVLDKLRHDADLQKITHPQWQAKILPREKGRFCGLVCLVAIAADAAMDISYALDEYLNVFIAQTKS